MTYLESGINILKTLEKEGFKAYFVGGYVRDKLLGIKTNDIDITTSAKPEEIEKIFPIIKTGIDFGTVMIKHEGYLFETTTFRFDGEYLDSRHPQSIIYSLNILDDLKRRDFTMNSLIMDKNEDIFDYHNGKKDIENHLIRCIGNPVMRFKEDALRILRAFAFMAKLNFTIEEETKKGIIKTKDLIINIASERIYNELEKMTINSLFAFKEMRNLGVSLFDLDEAIDFTVQKAINVSLDELFTLNCHFNGKISDFWHLKKKDRIKYQQASKMLKTEFLMEDIFWYGYEVSSLAFSVHNMMVDVHLSLDEIYSKMKIKCLKDLAIDGNDLLVYGKNIKQIQNRLVKEILDGTIDNNKDTIMKEVKKWNY